jgi:hypothetical protein
MSRHRHRRISTRLSNEQIPEAWVTYLMRRVATRSFGLLTIGGAIAGLIVRAVTACRVGRRMT